MHVRAVSDQHARHRHVVAPEGAAPAARRRLAGRRRQARAHAAKRLRQPFRPERLEQVVDRVDLERLQRVLVVGGDEHHRDVLLDQLEHLESVQFRHLHVEQQQIRLEVGDGLDGFEAVRALGDHFHPRFLFEVLAENGARRRLVVHDCHPQRERRHRATAIRALSFNGIRISRREHAGQASSIRTEAREPYSVSRRRFTF